jgi:peptidyl-dipeptidase Dcp
VRVWEVRDGSGHHRGLFFGDYFARSSKHSGAWMTTLRDQQKLTGDIRPLVVNVMNFCKAGEGEPTLLSFDDAKTLFHEFGHALHGLLSDVTFRIAGTSVFPTGRVAPAALRAWLLRLEILRRFAARDTGAPIPRTRRAADRRAHLQSGLHDGQPRRWVDPTCICRPRPTASTSPASSRRRSPHRHAGRDRHAASADHFGHIFAGGHAAAYYSYMWSGC